MSIPYQRRIGCSKGFGLIEVLIDVTILVLVLAAINVGMHTVTHGSVVSKNKAFAIQKAMQLMEELRGLAASTSLTALDLKDDQGQYNPILTIADGVTTQGDPISGNPDGKYVRLVEVKPVTQPTPDKYARMVYVHVYLAATHELLAETMSIIYDPLKTYVPTQVFDVYLIAIENSDGSWISIPQSRGIFDGMIQDLQTHVHGLEIHTHWITRLAYGRDPYYTPYMNKLLSAEVPGALPKAYVYPELTSYGSRYYDSNFMSGRIDEDGTSFPYGAVGNVTPPYYSMADRFNHAVRYPEEKKMYQDAVDAAKLAGRIKPERSLRMLLEEMSAPSTSASYKNAIVIDLHGHIVMPPMRNYSDAAKDPGNPNHIYRRVVTHPENLEYASGPVTLRVYAYKPNIPTGAADTAPTFIDNINLTFTDPAVTAANISVQKLNGDPATGAPYTAWTTATVGACLGNTSSLNYNMLPDAAGHLVLTLCDTPVQNGSFALSNGGLDPAQTGSMYGMEYVPSPASNNFTNDLNNPAAVLKNTARWKVTLNGLPANQYTVETRIASTTSSYPNLSRTYFWLGTSAPVTEKYQLLGDPRHMPYLDVKNNSGYNWYFRNSPIDTSIFPKALQAWSPQATNFMPGNTLLTMDVPRHYQLYREALLAAGAIYGSRGAPGYQLDLGGPILDQQTNVTAWQMTSTPWEPWAVTTPILVDEQRSYLEFPTAPSPGPYHNANLMVMQTGAAAGPPIWVSNPWLGELYPDNQFNGPSGWAATGNLPAGGSNSFYRGDPTTAGYYDIQEPTGHPYMPGTVSFQNGSAGGGTWFGYRAIATWSTHTDAAKDAVTIPNINIAFNATLPDTLGSCNAAELIDSVATDQPPEWTIPPYSTTGRISYAGKETYYSLGNDLYSALVQGTDSANRSAYFVNNGVCDPTQSGTIVNARLSLLTALRAFMTAGTVTGSGHVPQLPLIALTNPTDGAQITGNTVSVQWNPLAWTRWDGAPYTENYPQTAPFYTEPITVFINIKYSADGGNTWFFVDDQSPALAGVGVNTSHTLASTITTYAWDVTGLPKAHYLVRVEAYRQDPSGHILPHYAYHQTSFFILH